MLHGIHWTAVADHPPSWLILCREGERADADSYHDLMRSRFGKWGGRAVALAQVSGAPRGGMLEAGPWHGMTWHGCLTWPGCAMPYNAMPCHGVLCMPCGSHVTCVVWIAVCHATLPCRDAFPMLACGGRRHASPRPAMPFHAPLCYHCPSYVPAMTNHAMPVMPCQAAPCRFIAASYAPLEPQMLNSLGKCVVWLIILADLIVGR